MKKILFISICCILFNGCLSLSNHIQQPNHITGCYEATCWCWEKCICAPFSNKAQNADPIWSSMAILTYPFWIVDQVGEVVFDTVFIPWDLYRYHEYNKIKKELEK